MDKPVSQKDIDNIKLLSEEAGIIHLLKGEVDDQKVWAYAAIVPSKYDAFMARHNEGKSYDISEYGDILHSGTGERPSAKDIQYMVDEYNIMPDIEDQIDETITKILNTVPKKGM